MASKKLNAPVGAVASGIMLGATGAAGFAATSSAINAVQGIQGQDGLSNDMETEQGVENTDVISAEALREKEVAYKHNMIDVQNGIDTDVLNTGSIEEKRAFTEKVMESSLYGKQLAQANGQAYDVPDMFPDANGRMTVGIQSYEPTENVMTMTKGSETAFSSLVKEDETKKLSRDERVVSNTMQRTTSKQLDDFKAKDSVKTLEHVTGTVADASKSLMSNPTVKGAAIGVGAGFTALGLGPAVGGVMGATIGTVAPVVSNAAKNITSRVKQNHDVGNGLTKSSRVAQAEALSSNVQGISDEKDDSLGMV